MLCNRVFASVNNQVTEKSLFNIKEKIIKELEVNFLYYKNLMSTNLFKTIEGIAKEGVVQSVRTKAFSQKYGLASSTAQQSLEYLVDKEMVYEDLKAEGCENTVYDVFFENWLKTF